MSSISFKCLKFCQAWVQCHRALRRAVPNLDRMRIIGNLFNSSLGKKYTMAVTGCIMFLFLLGHMAGNLQIFFGRDVLNHYGHLLQSNPELIWPARIILLTVLGLHIWSAVRLTLENRAARGPVAYARHQPTAASYASRTMFVSGLIVFFFIVYHLLHFTFRAPPEINLTGQDFAQMRYTTAQGIEQHDVYNMMVAGFSNGWVSVFYGLGIGLLCFHLSHGIGAMFQSLGLKNEAYRRVLDIGAHVIALVIFLGYMSIPAAVLLGVVKPV